MKKIILSLLAGTLLTAACRKTRDDVVSQIETESYPTINFTGSRFYSINVGGSLPDVKATAYDSTIGESYSVDITGTDALDNSTPGLYVINATSRNKFGFITNENVYVAVTNIPASANLSGEYVRAASGYQVDVTELANGLYSISNFFGVSGLDADAYFVQVNDSTIDMPPQDTDLGELITSNQKLSTAPGDTTISFVLESLTTNRATRIFEKQ